jgi:O-antigen ligase
MDLLNDFYKLKLLNIVRFTLRQCVSFWLVLIYLVFEYLHPQDMYPILNIIPWMPAIFILSLFALVLEGRIFKVNNKANVLMMIFAFIVILSSVNALSYEASEEGFKTIFIFIFIYYLIINAVDNLEKYFVFLCIFILLSFKLSQFTFIGWVMRGFEYDKYGAVAGMAWLENTGELAIQFCILFVVSFYFAASLWKSVDSKFKRLVLVFIPISTIGGILACGSRGSFLALVTVIIFMWMSGKRKILGTVIILLIVVLVPAIMSDRDFERTINMGDTRDITGHARVQRWEKGIEMIRRRPILGVGFRNWGVADRLYFNGNGDLSHNIIIECASELGLVGLVVYILLVIINFKNNFETIRIARNNSQFTVNVAKSLNLALIAYLIAGFFVTVLFYPYFWINISMSVALNNITKNNYLYV